MKFSPVAVAACLALFISPGEAFFPSSSRQQHAPRSPTEIQSTAEASTASNAVTATTPKKGIEKLTLDIVSKLRFREVQRELEARQLDTSGTFTDMRQRLRHVAVTEGSDDQMAQKQTNGSEKVRVIDEEALNNAFQATGIVFQDIVDPDSEYRNLITEIKSLSEKLHWKAASRKLKKLVQKYGHASDDPRIIPEEVFISTLRAYMENRLHGARAAEPARRAMEEMVANGHSVPGDIANICIKESMGYEVDGTHEGFGGIDTALAMLAAVEVSKEPPMILDETYEKIIATMATEGSLDDSLQLLREFVVEKSRTPSLKLFADVAFACVDGVNDPEKVMTSLIYLKAAGYDLDNIASTVDGRRVLAAGVIAAEKIDNVGLGLRFLTAASKAEGCAPDKGDDLVASLSPTSQRACTIIHRNAIRKAVQDNSWKLAVRLLELMLERGLKPSPRVWTDVVTCCAKNEKSRKATALLMDWVQLYNAGRAEKPPLRMFNTVVNACEVCGEEELTIHVLDSMKETHKTDGNLITFNIALKRLAKQGNTRACEGIIVGMLQGNIEPSVVSYTTAIAACVADPKNSELAVEWIKRMKSRNVQPNVITYNTALASCLDGTLAGTMRASTLASDMVADIRKQVDSGIIEMDEYTNIIPNFYTRTLARQAMKQLKSNWENGDIDKAVAKSTVRVPLLELVEFLKTDLATLAAKQKESITGSKAAPEEEEDDLETTVSEVDEELEYSAAISTHRAAAV
ncbi:PPR: pentatricopeptide repeat domain containing protein [Nitzschia inconspicua]|uniref:PPR: pentatricopeptide repeat domain containing protein n=1 Tax=Nitzschia inconspicua TaxID=303405 RepID=A0A9K3LRH1_9STRA|nr:PPR: pentatricopeptide repeat domain containing protein [Nitzschia inconspicua]